LRLPTTSNNHNTNVEGELDVLHTAINCNTNDAKDKLDISHATLIPDKHMLGHTLTAPKEAMLGYAHVTSLVAMSLEFKERVIKGYAADRKWNQILRMLKLKAIYAY
jgi:hypothetical protein